MIHGSRNASRTSLIRIRVHVLRVALNIRAALILSFVFLLIIEGSALFLIVVDLSTMSEVVE